MTHMDLKLLTDLGIGKEELLNRVVDKITDQVMNSYYSGEDDDQIARTSQFARKLSERAEKAVDQAVNSIADKYVLPKVEEMVENLTLQETNRWGEKTGKRMTFVEYLVARAETYMTEQVNYDGKSKEESRDSYSFKGQCSRVAYMIHQHLHHSIKTAMEQALGNLNSTVAKGLEETVKLKLAETLASFKVTTKIG
jgi:hypothetical protein